LCDSHLKNRLFQNVFSVARQHERNIIIHGNLHDHFGFVNVKKVKGRLAGSSTLKLLSLLYPTPEVVPSFISRSAIAPSSMRALC
jgi:hypothetical protein